MKRSYWTSTAVELDHDGARTYNLHNSSSYIQYDIYNMYVLAGRIAGRRAAFATGNLPIDRDSVALP